MLFEAFWQASARMILVGLNADEPKMSLAEGEKLQALPMAHSHRAVARVSLPLPRFRLRPGSRLRTAGYVERLRRSVR